VGLTILSEELRHSVVKVQDELKREDPHHIFHPATSFHITIKPVGSIGTHINEGDLGTIMEGFRRVVSKFGGFDISLEGLGAFSDVVYARVQTGREQIIELNKKLSDNLRGIVTQGIYEGDAMVPHVTLTTFTTSDVDSLMTEVRRRESQFIGRMEVKDVAIIKVFLNRYYGNEKERGRAFEPLETIHLSNRNLRIA